MGTKLATELFARWNGYLERGLGMTGTEGVADKALAAPRVILPYVQPPILGGRSWAWPLHHQARLTPEPSDHVKSLFLRYTIIHTK
jgi:hypothetical protein